MVDGNRGVSCAQGGWQQVVDSGACQCGCPKDLAGGAGVRGETCEPVPWPREEVFLGKGGGKWRPLAVTGATIGKGGSGGSGGGGERVGL